MRGAPPEVLRALEVETPASTLDLTDDFGLFHPLEYAWSTWRRYREHGLLPREGGYDDQFLAWQADVNALDGRYFKHWEDAKAEWDEQHRRRDSFG